MHVIISFPGPTGRAAEDCLLHVLLLVRQDVHGAKGLQVPELRALLLQRVRHVRARNAALLPWVCGAARTGARALKWGWVWLMHVLHETLGVQDGTHGRTCTQMEVDLDRTCVTAPWYVCGTARTGARAR